MAAHAAEVQQLQSDASLARKAADDAIQDAAEANTRAATAQAAASDAADAARAREQELVRELDACRGRCDELAADASSRAKSHDQLDTELREARAEVSSLRGVVQQLQEQVRRCIPAQPALPGVTICGAVLFYRCAGCSTRSGVVHCPTPRVARGHCEVEGRCTWRGALRMAG